MLGGQKYIIIYIMADILSKFDLWVENNDFINSLINFINGLSDFEFQVLVITTILLIALIIIRSLGVGAALAFLFLVFIFYILIQVDILDFYKESTDEKTKRMEMIEEELKK